MPRDDFYLDHYRLGRTDLAKSGARDPSKISEDGPRWRKRLSCSSGMISGRARLSFTREVLSSSLFRFDRKALSDFFLESGTQLAVVPTTGNPPGANVIRHLGLPPTLLCNFECLFRSFFVQLL